MIHCLLHVLMSGVHHRLVLTAGALRSEQKERVTVRCTVFFQFVCRSLALSIGCSLIGYHCVNRVLVIWNSDNEAHRVLIIVDSSFKVKV